MSQAKPRQGGGARGAILFLTRYGQLGASSRYRFFQYFPALEQAGFRCEFSPLLDDHYLENRYRTGGVALADMARGLLRRLISLGSLRRFDLVVIEKELVVYFPALFERAMAAAGIPYLVDYDDAIFHQYDQHPNPLVRALLGGKVAQVMRHSRMVVAGNDYLASYAMASGAPRVETLPTVVDLERYRVPGPPAGDQFVIGWIGTPSTVRYVEQIAPALAEVCAGGRGSVVLIGGGEVSLPDVPVRCVSWSEATEVAEMSRFSVGIMPLPRLPWALGKCGFKLIQYMACRRAVVASPVGMNTQIVTEGENGLLAEGSSDWVRALVSLRDDPALARRLGEAGRRRVEERYCLQVTAPRLVQLIGESMEGAR